MEPIIIIGSGLAAYNLAKEFRKLDTTTPLLFICADDGCFYSKPMLSNALEKGKSADELVMGDSDKMAADLNAQVMAYTRVEGIDPASHCVNTSSDETIAYSKLVLALGAYPIIPPMAGDGAELIYTVNSLTDYREFRDAIEGKKHIAIIGPGLIGCEFANDLTGAGFSVTVIGPDKTPISSLIPAEVGAKLQQVLGERGVTWQLGTTCTEVNRHAGGFSLTLANGQTVQADVVLSAIGLRPETVLAEDSGLKVNRGIVVNRHLQTDKPDIYAMGDCAEVEGMVLPFVMPLMQQARALAKTLAGEPTEVSYPAMPVMIKTTACPLVVAPPPGGVAGEWQVVPVGEGLKAIYIGKDSGQTVGFALCGAEAVKEKMALSKELPVVLP
ncbi:MAG: FAD-dependent oxidoreductase [Gammaproteobacteria bacterium]|nr:FAD-dependent oxidoreductase [Gammaproteobacteria bacterium]MDH5650756.1 FAD-dependent oxidoreductase [Gammaproteobacteria bacterium]